MHFFNLKKYLKTNTDDTFFYLCIRTRINSEITAKIRRVQFYINDS